MQRVRTQRGFTLIEVMIVISILGILFNIAAPSLFKARESARRRACITNLRRIDAAKEQYTLISKRRDGQAVVGGLNTLVTGGYLKTLPRCPSTNVNYNVRPIGQNPTCQRAAQGHIFTNN